MSLIQNLKYSIPKKIVLIGASTGGPGHIQKIIQSLPKFQDTSIVIGQHMVKGFMNSFADRFKNIDNNIVVVEDNQAFEANYIYICEEETKLIDNYFSRQESHSNSYNPDINILFNSFIPLAREVEILCVILTGIGDDGVKACRDLNLHGSRCITESEESAIVDGMPSRARLLVDNIEIYDIDTITKKISEFCE